MEQAFKEHAQKMADERIDHLKAEIARLEQLYHNGRAVEELLHSNLSEARIIVEGPNGSKLIHHVTDNSKINIWSDVYAIYEAIEKKNAELKLLPSEQPSDPTAEIKPAPALDSLDDIF